MAFPQTQYYQGSQVIFSNPYVTLAADNIIAINVDIKGNEGDAMLSASAELSGEVHYNGTTGELQIMRPQLDDFTVHDSNQIEEEKIAEWVAQLKGQSAPVILLLDFKQLDLSFIGNRVPSRMWVEKGQLVVEY
ncbi:hypothetical protein [Alteromonas sp. C1M14]|uniref:hypothetical protein n=1 Tax=Alteromonas sp. C1M14 TaxID=2841567 RepID=UPI001C086DC2|nr:hypothetical protein [Alteromonas sp. C1M14]MBU2980060.1 hypothetical protein [Alteromonas sp. C1M14]